MDNEDKKPKEENIPLIEINIDINDINIEEPDVKIVPLAGCTMAPRDKTFEENPIMPLAGEAVPIEELPPYITPEPLCGDVLPESYNDDKQKKSKSKSLKKKSKKNKN